MSAYSELILAETGLVGYWRLGESAGPTAIDAFSTNDGTYNSTGITYSVEGALRTDPDTAVTFLGVALEGRIDLPATTFLAADSSVTVEFWNLVIAGNGGGSAFTIGKADAPNRCMAHCPFSDNTLYWDYGDQGAGGRVSTSYTPYLDKWTHIALIFDTTSNLHAIYLNGELAASSTNANSPGSALTGGEIGSWSASGYHRGSLDEFALYNVALADADIHEHFLTGVRAGIPQQPLVASRW